MVIKNKIKQLIASGENNIIEFKTSFQKEVIETVAFKGKYFKRIKNSNHQMNLIEITNLHLQSTNISWDSHTDMKHMFDSISLDKIIVFLEKSNIHRTFPVQDDPLTLNYANMD